jgi:F-box domain
MGDVIIVNLPTEIQFTILAFLDIQSLLAIRQVSTSSTHHIIYLKFNSSQTCT